MSQALVPVKVSNLNTAVHEAMHAATLIYKTIDNMNDPEDYKQIDRIFDWILWECTIIEDDANESAGCFRHRSFGRFTDNSNISCSLSGFVGGYIMTGYDKKRADSLKEYIRRGTSLFEYVINNDMKCREDVRHFYKMWSSDEDFDTAYEKAERNLDTFMKYLKDVVYLVDHSDAYLDLIVEITECLIRDHTLDRAYLNEIASRYKERIICEAFCNRNIVCVSLNQFKRATYQYYKI